jgi:hypothetical protein
MDDGEVHALRVYGSTLVVGGSFTKIGGSTVNRIARWNGASWSTMGIGFSSSVYSLTVIGGLLFAGGVFEFANLQPANRVAVWNGSVWGQLGSGITGSGAVVRALSGYTSSLIVGGDFYTAGGLPVNNIAGWGSLIGIVKTGSPVPNAFSLSQNYPNPFNPSTNIEFSVKDFGFVSVKIFNVAGREAETLISQNLNPGSYKITWDASNFPSGVYYYSMTAGDFKDTKKMIVLK